MRRPKGTYPAPRRNRFQRCLEDGAYPKLARHIQTSVSRRSVAALPPGRNRCARPTDDGSGHPQARREGSMGYGEGYGDKLVGWMAEGYPPSGQPPVPALTGAADGFAIRPIGACFRAAFPSCCHASSDATSSTASRPWCHVAVLDGVEVDVVDVVREILVGTDRVLPIARLPDATAQQGRHAQFETPPPRGIVRIAVGKCPDSM